MKIGFLFTLGVFLICTHARAEQLFEVCDNVVDNSNYKPMKEYLSETRKPNNLCQRLTNHEFLYTDNRNIYYCNSRNRPLSCGDHKDGTWFPDTSVARRFSGKNGKKYVLLKTSRLSQGVFGSGYHAFFLVPRNVEPRGYIIFSFAGAGEHNGSYSDGGQVCNNLGDVAEALTSTRVPFEIVNEGQSNPIIRFNQEITMCKTGEVFNQTLEYTWQEGTFQKTIDKKEAVQPKKETTRVRLREQQRGPD